MSYSGYGALGAIGFVILAGGYTMVDRGMNYSAAQATVFRIDRECGFNTTNEGGKSELVRQDCSTTDEFKEISKADRRSNDVDGTAVVKVSYTAPQDGSSRTSELRFSGRDDEFYKLKAGDEIGILVSNEDPSDIRLN